MQKKPRINADEHRSETALPLTIDCSFDPFLKIQIIRTEKLKISYLSVFICVHPWFKPDYHGKGEGYRVAR